MKTEILPLTEKLVLKYGLDILRFGEAIAFPTDTVYGLGALAFDPQAVEKIYAAKIRPLEKAIPVLLSSASDLPKIASGTNEMIEKLATRFWPGALTLIVPKLSSVPEVVSATDTVAVRVPNYAPLRKLLEMSGPLAVTSANISGKESPITAQEVFNQLNGRIPIILDGGKTAGGIASTIVDCTQSTPIILREGPISLNEIESALNKT